MCNKTLDVFLRTLKFLPDWFVTSNMIKKLDDDLFSNDDMIFINKDSNNVTCFSDQSSVDLIVQILIISALMVLTWIKMILKLLFM